MDREKAYEELSFIKKVMEDSQKALFENGKILIVLSLFSLAAVAAKVFKDFIGWKANSLFIYVPMLLIGCIYGVYSKKRAYSRMGGATYAAKSMDHLWIAFLISTFVLCIVGYASGGIRPTAVPPVVAVLFGFTQYMSGVLSNQRWISAPAFGWWISSGIMFFRPGEHAVILIGILLILFQLIPGILVYRSWKKRHHA
jgi:hypothetical protein